MTSSQPSRPARYRLGEEVHDYPDWNGAPLRTILICTHPRSGSTMLGEALYFAGGLGCALEYVHAGSRSGFEERWGVTGLRQLIGETWRRRTDPNGTCSIKLFWRDIADLADEFAPNTFPDLRTVPADDISPETYRALHGMLCTLFPNPSHIFLERRDLLRRAISSLTAQRTGVWRKIPGIEDIVSNQDVTYDFERICDLIVGSRFCNAHWHAFFSANNIHTHHVIYENLIGDYPRVISELLRALGRPASIPKIRMERQSNENNEILIQRFLRDQRHASGV